MAATRTCRPRLACMQLWDDLRPLLLEQICLDLSCSNGRPSIVGREAFIDYVRDRSLINLARISISCRRSKSPALPA